MLCVLIGYGLARVVLAVLSNQFIDLNLLPLAACNGFSLLGFTITRKYIYINFSVFYLFSGDKLFALTHAQCAMILARHIFTEIPGKHPMTAV